MTALVLQADARCLPLPGESVDLVVTSPPYFGLRSYTDGGEHYGGQIGSEATPREYVAALLDCTREWMRVLKPAGSLWVNLGDKYSGYYGPNWLHDRNPGGGERKPRGYQELPQSAPTAWGVANKSLMGLPWRYALGCIDELGLILRAEVIWSKPNGLPESVTDRVRRSHEQLFHFTRMPRYYSAVDEIREAHTGNTPGRRKDGQMSPKEAATVEAGHRRGFFPEDRENPLGKLPGSVWDIPSQPLTVPPELGVDHFAAFPMELPRRIIQGWSPPGICTRCGEGRRPVADRTTVFDKARDQTHASEIAARAVARSTTTGGTAHSTLNGLTTRLIIGYACGCSRGPGCSGLASCTCSDCIPLPPTRPAVVLDPFGGTGTAALVADVLGRTGISVDRSADYCRLAAWRTTDPGQRAQAMKVPKPPAQIDGQGQLDLAVPASP